MKVPKFQPLLNKTIAICLLLFLNTNCSSSNEDTEPASILVNTEYNILIEGEGYVGGLVSRFQVPALLVIVQTIPDNLQRNGVNPVDVGIFTTLSPIVGHAGALYFGTNTSLSSRVGSNLGASAIDIAFVQINRNTNTIAVEVDGNIFGLPSARLGTFNIYNMTSGLFAQIHNVLAGNVSITVNGNQVQGTIQLGGSSGFAGPGITSNYIATFSGSRGS